MYNLHRENYEKLWHEKEIPYVFEIRKGNKVLIYFGANHSHNPKDKQYKLLRRYWRQFIRDKKIKNKIIFVEGRLRPLRKNQTIAIKSGSEGSLVTYLAYKSKIPVLCPEPNQPRLNKVLKNQFKEEEIKYYHFTGLVNNWHRLSPKPAFKKWLKETLPLQASARRLNGFTLDRLLKIHKKLFGKFNYQDQKFFNRIANPNRNDTVINKIARTTSDIRDNEFIKILKREWNKGKSIFAVFGSGHAILEESILKKILK